VYGDALCSFNPVYGQGTTVAIMESFALRQCLAVGTDDIVRRFFRGADRLIDTLGKSRSAAICGTQA
jgi:2-polyprenyl-6-methoxyphenol hydroxylase-like FAD-dependent oxidoreductase